MAAMKPVAWMVGMCVASWWALTALAVGVAGPEVPAGMAGPLVAAVTTWVVVERAFRTSPARVTGLMMTAFVAKMVFFGVYVVVALAVLRLRSMPFIISFTCYFVALHLTEAELFRRLFRPGAPAVPSEQMPRS
jgi:hypothetical protein